MNRLPPSQWNPSGDQSVGRPRTGATRARLVLLALGIGLCANTARPDTLQLPTGEILKGRVVERSDTTILFDSNGLGRISVPAKGVEVSRDEPATAAKSPSRPLVAESSPMPATPPAPSAKPQPPQSWVRQALRLPPQFTGMIDIGADVLNSDVNMRDYVVDAGFGWKNGKNEYATHHAYERMTVNGAKTTDTHDESLRWIRHIDPRWMFLSQADWRHDGNQGVQYRTDLIAVPGYYFFKYDRWSLLGGVGPSYEWSKWMTPGAKPMHRFNVAAYEVFRFQLTKTLALRQTFLGYDDPKDTADTRYVLDVNLRQRLGAGLSLILNYDRRHDSRPAPRSVTDQDRLTTKLGYEF